MALIRKKGLLVSDHARGSVPWLHRDDIIRVSVATPDRLRGSAADIDVWVDKHARGALRGDIVVGLESVKILLTGSEG